MASRSKWPARIPGADVPALHARWCRKARQVFTLKDLRGDAQWDRALSLARDVYKALDPEGFRRG